MTTMIAKPDFSGATTLTAPASLFQYGGTNGSNTWTPSLTTGVDYLLDITAGVALYTISIKGGRHVGIIGGHVTQTDLGGPSIYISGGDTNRIVWLEGLLVDDYGFGESDGIRTHNAGTAADTTIIALKFCRFEYLRGQSNPQFGTSPTTLNGGITSGAASLVVTSAAGVPPTSFAVLIDSEVIIVGNQAGTTYSSLTRGANGTTAAAHSNGASVAYTNDWGGATLGTHSDAVQLANGAAAFYAEDCTFQGRYSNLQLQREQSESGSIMNIDNLVSLGAIGPGGRYQARCTMHAGFPHGLTTSDYAQFGKASDGTGTNVSPSGWNGTYRVVNVVDTLNFDVDFGVVVPPASYSSGTNFACVKKSNYTYAVGPNYLHRVNFRSQPNSQQNLSQNPNWNLNYYRVAGRPDAKAFADRTPLVEENGPFTFDTVYFDQNGTPNTVGSLCNPGDAGTIYPTAQAVVSGSAPNRTVTYPSWPKFTGSLVEDTSGVDFCPRSLIGRKYPQVPVRGRAA